MNIRILNENETKRYAAEELAKYLGMMDPEIEIAIGGESSENTVTLGYLSELSLDESGVSDDMIDDVTDIDIKNLSGYIAGSNDRSILMGVYNYLKSAGCSWVRPGPLGEYIPKKDMKTHCYISRKKADFPFRGECIEGAVSYEHLCDTVVWLPKVNMNLFMIEQIVPYNYMSRWYKHSANTKLADENLPYEKYCEYCEKLELLIKKCGLQLHTLGHGALNEAFGLRYLTRDDTPEIPDEVRSLFALINGKRDLWNRSLFATQFCMSDKRVRDTVVNWLANYLDERPHVDFLHFWLSDSQNNHCECEECVKSTPSDWYVMMLNQLDAELTARGNKAKIVFIMYVDTRWPPVVEKLNNPSRFILTTAYEHKLGQSYFDKKLREPYPKWKRNCYQYEGGIMSFVEGWEKANFRGTKFFFEYFLYKAHYSDPGYMSFSRAICEDTKTLGACGFNGIMSDQTQRSYFPTALPNSILGETLYDSSINTEGFIDKYLSDAYGADWRAAKEYLDTISALFDYKMLSLDIDVTAQDENTGAVDTREHTVGIIGNTAAGERIKGVYDVTRNFEPTVKKNLSVQNPCHKESWRILSYHTEYSRRLADICIALSENDKDGAKKIFNNMIDYLSEIEMEIHPYFDLDLFTTRTRQLISGDLF